VILEGFRNGNGLPTLAVVVLRCASRRSAHVLVSGRRDASATTSMQAVVVSAADGPRCTRATRRQARPGRVTPLMRISGGASFRRRARRRAASARASRRCALQVRCLPHEQDDEQCACCSGGTGLTAPRRSVMSVFSFRALGLITPSRFAISADINSRAPQGCHRQAITESMAPNIARLMPVSLRPIL
jgi:hypothetical protein